MEHQNPCQKGAPEKSALAEHAWESYHPRKGRRPQWLTRPGPPQGAVAEGGNPHPVAQTQPLTGMGDWSCLDAGWQPWEQGSRGDPPLPVARSHATPVDSK